MTVRLPVRELAGPTVAEVRDVYQSGAPDLLRIAALIDIAGAAATLARTIMRLRHIDPALLYPLVADRIDVGAVLGRGQWLPTMTRHIPAPPARRAAVVRLPARTAAGGQPTLFDQVAEG